jgi:hypothetical protein
LTIEGLPDLVSPARPEPAVRFTVNKLKSD